MSPAHNPAPSSDASPDAAPAFEGFDLPRQNWFKMPSIWTDITAEIGGIAELKVVEYVLKHTWGYQEFGMLKRITNDEFMHGRRRKDGSRLDKGTGLTKKSVIAGLKSAVARGLLLEESDNSDGGRVKKFYSLRMGAWVKEEQAQNEEYELEAVPDEIPYRPRPRAPQATPTSHVGDDDDDAEGEFESDFEGDGRGVKKGNAGVYFLHSGVKKVYPRGIESIPRTEKETLERQQQDVVVALAFHGVAKNVAQRLARAHPPAFIAEKLAYLEFLLAERPDEIQRPAAWLRKAVEDDFEAPDGFLSAADRERVANDEKRRLQVDLEAMRHQTADLAAQAQKQAARAAAQRAVLQERFGTTGEDEAFWQAVMHEFRHGAGLPSIELVADARILHVTDEAVQLGIPRQDYARALLHPNTQIPIRRAFKLIARRALALEVVWLDPAVFGPAFGDEFAPRLDTDLDDELD